MPAAPGLFTNVVSAPLMTSHFLPPVTSWSIEPDWSNRMYISSGIFGGIVVVDAHWHARFTHVLFVQTILHAPQLFGSLERSCSQPSLVSLLQSAQPESQAMSHFPTKQFGA